MRTLALALALCFAVAPMDAAARRPAKMHTMQVKTKKNKNAPKARKAKKPAKHSRNTAN